jgi:Tfp pilus assembly protein PilV
MTPARRPTPHAEEGFALIEVLISALILAIVSVGIMALLEATTHSAANERQHSAAQALAQEDQARLRSMRLSTLNRLNEERNLTIDGSRYTVTSEGTFINSSTRQPSACTSGATAADYVRITSKVSWPEGQQPIVMRSIVSPANGSLDPTHGSLIVTAKTPTGEPIAGLPLSGTGPGTFSGSTDSTGCANFSDLPAGNYTVTPNSTSLVGKDGQYPHEVQTGVTEGASSTLNLEYGRPASIPVQFEYRLNSSSSYKTAKVDSAYFSDTNGTAVYWTTDKTRQLSLLASPVYPFPDAVTIWAGSCSGNYPEATGRVTKTFQPGEQASVPVKLKVPAFEVTVTDTSGNPIKNAEVTLSDENCNDESGRDLTRTYITESRGHQAEEAISVEPEYGIPTGKYGVCAVAFYSSRYRRKRETGWEIKSYSSTAKKTLALSESSTSRLTCP